MQASNENLNTGNQPSKYTNTEGYCLCVCAHTLQMAVFPKMISKHI